MNLQDALTIVLSHIEEIEIELVDTILGEINYSQVSYFAPVFEFLKQYYEAQKQFPSTVFTASQFQALYVPTTAPLSQEVVNILLYELKKDVAINKTMQALQDRDTDKAQEILSENIVKAEITETNPGNLVEDYEARDFLPQGISTGVSQLDNVYRAFAYRTNNFIAAPQKAGKTSVAVSISYDALIKRNLNVVYLTLEVAPNDLLANYYARHAYELGMKLDAQKIKYNLLDEQEKENLKVVENHFMKHLEDNGGKLSIIANHDFPEFTFSYIKQYLEQKWDEWGRIDLVVIDHIGLTGFYKMKGVTDMKERINTHIKWWTDMAKGFRDGFILLTLMQVNRQGTLMMKKGKPIGFEVLADANEAERSAHTVTVMYSNGPMLMANTVRIYSLANRNGPPLVSEADDNSIDTYLNPATYVFGHRKYGDTLSLQNKDLLKQAQANGGAVSLFS